MTQINRAVQLSDYDLRFLVETAAPDASDPERLKDAVRGDESFRNAFIADKRVFQRVSSDDEAFVRLSPALYFEILLRKALTELQTAPFTTERAGTQNVVVFDAKDVAGLLSKEPVLDYLAAMLASFTRVNTYTRMVRVKPNVWRRHRVSDMDIDSLIRLCANAEEEERIQYFKRIADVCLFILGIFPDHAPFDYRYPGSGVARPPLPGHLRRGLQDYEDEGRRFYKLAEEHPSAKSTNIAEVFHLLHEHFSAAKKPLNFIAQHYLHQRRDSVFQGA